MSAKGLMRYRYETNSAHCQQLHSQERSTSLQMMASKNSPPKTNSEGYFNLRPDVNTESSSEEPRGQNDSWSLNHQKSREKSFETADDRGGETRDSLTSEAPSLSPSGDSGVSSVRGEQDNSFDEGIEDILSQNPVCNMCGHAFHNSHDFLQHVRLHFSTGNSGKVGGGNAPKVVSIGHATGTACQEGSASPNTGSAIGHAGSFASRVDHVTVHADIAVSHAVQGVSERRIGPNRAESASSTTGQTVSIASQRKNDASSSSSTASPAAATTIQSNGGQVVKPGAVQLSSGSSSKSPLAPPPPYSYTHSSVHGQSMKTGLEDGRYLNPQYHYHHQHRPQQLHSNHIESSKSRQEDHHFSPSSLLEHGDPRVLEANLNSVGKGDSSINSGCSGAANINNYGSINSTLDSIDILHLLEYAEFAPSLGIDSEAGQTGDCDSGQQETGQSAGNQELNKIEGEQSRRGKEARNDSSRLMGQQDCRSNRQWQEQHNRDDVVHMDQGKVDRKEEYKKNLEQIQSTQAMKPRRVIGKQLDHSRLDRKHTDRKQSQEQPKVHRPQPQPPQHQHHQQQQQHHYQQHRYREGFTSPTVAPPTLMKLTQDPTNSPELSLHATNTTTTMSGGSTTKSSMSHRASTNSNLFPQSTGEIPRNHPTPGQHHFPFHHSAVAAAALGYNLHSSSVPFNHHHQFHFQLPQHLPPPHHYPGFPLNTSPGTVQPATRHHQPAIAPPPYSTVSPAGFLPPSTVTSTGESFPCYLCPGVMFPSREEMYFHMSLHHSRGFNGFNGLGAGYFAGGSHQSLPGTSLFTAGQTISSGVKRAREATTEGSNTSSGHHLPNCQCGCRATGGGRKVKKAKKQVEDIDPETLKRIQSLEWERKHGYWCTKCKKRFESQSKLVDHMSYSEEHNYTKQKQNRKGSTELPDSPSGSTNSSSVPSPASSIPSPLSSMSSSLASVPSPLTSSYSLLPSIPHS